MATTTIAADRIPGDWAGSARRVEVIFRDGRALYGWQLTKTLEGYVAAGQLWFDGEDESTEPSPDWEIEAL